MDAVGTILMMLVLGAPVSGEVARADGEPVEGLAWEAESAMEPSEVARPLTARVGRFEWGPSEPMAVFEAWEEPLGDPRRALALPEAGVRFSLVGEGRRARPMAFRDAVARELMRGEVEVRPLVLGETPVLVPTGGLDAGLMSLGSPGPMMLVPEDAPLFRPPEALRADARSVSLQWAVPESGWALRGTGERRAFDDEIDYLAVSAEAAYPLGRVGGLRIGYELFRQQLPGQQSLEAPLPEERVFMEFRWRF